MRQLLLVIVSAVVCDIAVGQEPKDDAKRAVERKKLAEAYLKDHPSEIPEFLELLEKSNKAVEDLLDKVKLTDDDTPKIRAAKRSLLAEHKRLKLILERRDQGLWRSEENTQLCDTVACLYKSAELLWSDPGKLLPFAECITVELFKMELSYKLRAGHDLDPAQFLPQFEAARLRAEVLVLDLREKAKKK